ncbi:MAG: hypothetical protein AB7T49_11460 [Oligoflexales bacterium]
MNMLNALATVYTALATNSGETDFEEYCKDFAKRFNAPHVGSVKINGGACKNVSGTPKDICMCVGNSPDQT